MIGKAINTPLDKVRVLQRKLDLEAKANPKRKFGVLYDKVCREDALRTAYAQVRANIFLVHSRWSLLLSARLGQNSLLSNPSSEADEAVGSNGVVWADGCKNRKKRGSF